MRRLCLVLITSLLILAGCSNNVQTMLDDYNSSFAPSYEFKEPCPGDVDFKAENMLMGEYYVSSDDTLNLFGPYNADSYEWICTDPDDESGTEVSVRLFKGYTKFQREYIVYIPNSGLKAGKTYKLTLTVTDKEGVKYTDSCGLIIYQHYDFN